MAAPHGGWPTLAPRHATAVPAPPPPPPPTLPFPPSGRCGRSRGRPLGAQSPCVGPRQGAVGRPRRGDGGRLSMPPPPLAPPRAGLSRRGRPRACAGARRVRGTGSCWTLTGGGAHAGQPLEVPLERCWSWRPLLECRQGARRRTRRARRHRRAHARRTFVRALRASKTWYILRHDLREHAAMLSETVDTPLFWSEANCRASSIERPCGGAAIA